MYSATSTRRADQLGGLWEQLYTEEMRNWLGTPRRYQLLDFLGVALGSYFLWDGWGRNNLNVALGAIMVYIHAQRFLVAPQVQAAMVEGK